MHKGEMPLIVTDKGDTTIEESFQNKAIRDAQTCVVLTAVLVALGLGLLLD